MNAAQTRYTTTERELLAIVETFKEFRNILLGQQLRVYTDHKNLTFKNFNTERVMRWRLIIEEFNPELIYIKGERNIVADALSRLDIESSSTPEFQPGGVSGSNLTAVEENHAMHEYYGNTDEDLPLNAFPLRFKEIQKAQQSDSELLDKLKYNDKYSIRTYRAGGKRRDLITREGKICIPPSLQQRVIDWYHVQLCHPGENRTEQTIRQHLHWDGIRQQVAKTIKTCPTCQKTKRSTKKYRHLPPKDPDAVPWETLCVDLVGPYTTYLSKVPKKRLLYGLSL